MEITTSNEVTIKKYTPEQLKVLQDSGVLGFTEEDKFPYVPEIFRTSKDEEGRLLFPKEDWPIFQLKGKNGIEIAKLEDQGSYSEMPGDLLKDKSAPIKIVTQSGNQRLEILKKGVLGWKNWFDRDNKEIKCSINGVNLSNNSLEKIPADLQMELAEAINERNQLTDEEKEGLDF